MTAIWNLVVQRNEVAQYDGTNGADVVAGLSGATFASDTGSVLTFDEGGSTYTANAGDYILRSNNNVFSGVYGSMSAAVLFVAVPAPELVHAVGGPVSVPASVLGQTQPYTVNLPTAMPSTDYAVVAELRGAPNIVSGHSVLSVTIVDEDTVSVSVQSGAASLAGASLYCTAWAVSSS